MGGGESRRNPHDIYFLNLKTDTNESPHFLGGWEGKRESEQIPSQDRKSSQQDQQDEVSLRRMKFKF